MHNIGQRIKELRKKNDLTQERLAEFLGVTDKAVSKWECGLTTPDLALIMPLARILQVSADELLGGKQEEVDERKAYFDAEYHEFWKKEDHEADMEIARQAVREYPGDFRYLHWLASNEWYVGYSVKYCGTEKEKELLESSLHHHLMILENCDDTELRNNAISGLVFANKSLNRIDEAKKYALMYPEVPETSRESLLGVCLKGDELADHRQKILRNGLGALCNALFEMWVYDSCDKRYASKALEAEEKILKIIIDDCNFNGFHVSMYLIKERQAEIAVTNGDFDEAISYLEQAKKHAIEYDQVMKKRNGKFTCLLLDHYEDDYMDSRIERALVESWKKEMSENKIFDVLREREEFQNLMNK